MRTKLTVLAGVLTLAGLGAVSTMITGCETTAQESTPAAASSTAADSTSTGLSGAQLWAQTCAHCHNSRSPASYSDANWEIAVSHMRQQAYLSGDQARKIMDFLKASN